MLNIFHRNKHWWEDKKKRPILIIGVLVIALLLFRVGQGLIGSADTAIDSSTAEVELIAAADTIAALSTVQASGEVKAEAQVELRSEVSARVARVNVSLGQEVYAGQVLVVFNNGGVVSQRNDAWARVQGAQAGLEQFAASVEAQEARLDELKRGPRPEELSSAQSAFANADTSVEVAEAAYDAAIEKAAQDYDSLLKSSVAKLAQSTQSAKDATYTVTNAQYTYFRSVNNEDSRQIAAAKARVNSILFNKEDTGLWTVEALSSISGGVEDTLLANLQDPSETETRAAALVVVQGLQQAVLMYNAVPLKSNMTAADIALLQAGKQSIQAALTSATSVSESLDVQKAANDSAIQAAEGARQNAESAYDAARERLQLVKAGAAPEQITAQEASLRQAEASYRAQLAQLRSAQASVGSAADQVQKTIITAPISGKISTLPVRVGELASPGAVVTSIVNTNALKVTAYIDSSQLSYIRQGAAVTIGNNATGTVTFISPAIDPLTRKVEVAISVAEQQTNAPLVVGQYVDVAIDAAEADRTMLQAILPLQAVEVTPEGTAVFIIEDNMVKAVPVELGRVRGKSVEVIAGLEDAHNVISSVRGLEVGETVTAK
ncbi:MAG: efflux RND transporter periplasmic adaptor subunit [Candidatus Magasanikbacteria bacterium]|jgi:membrane fusion protein, multidrug efflux system|nr:efflux RND transporter periplasmic adaptor subunit [Candidatus Magasanikbacteria bacterium]